VENIHESAKADFHELRQGFSPTIQCEERKVMTYWRLHYHLIWATYNREPTLGREREKMFYGVLYKKAEELELKIHVAGNMEDHAHVVASIPPKLAVADCVHHLKGASAYAINHMAGSDGKFKWQGGYGALSVGERSLGTVMEYAAKQKEHHRENRLVEVYERIYEKE
jgi:putative transposase